ncbi:MAG: helix-turn-helix transcriptional regulator, partial [Raoultibacter sp.]
AAAIRPLNKNPHETEMALSSAPSNAIISGEKMSRSEGCLDDVAFGEQADFSESITQFHQDLAEEFALSPRETEVFLLLAHGRSRPYIRQAIYLSDGTVKTHIAHIYKKFNVSSRQELLTAIQEAQATWGKSRNAVSASGPYK